MREAAAALAFPLFPRALPDCATVRLPNGRLTPYVAVQHIGTKACPRGSCHFEDYREGKRYAWKQT